MSNKYITIDKFKGCLVGATAGDCLGAPFEMDRTIATASLLKSYFQHMSDPSSLRNLPLKSYTDDTAMTFALSKSLLRNGGVNVPELAGQFTHEYLKDPNRGYGKAVQSIFTQIAFERLYESAEDEPILELAEQQFNGQGSYGNGAAMRVAPIALFHAKESYEKMIESAEKQSLITHFNGLAVLGAVIQACAVRQALESEPGSIDPKKFLDNLKNCLVTVDSVTIDQKTVFIEKLDSVFKFLNKKNIDEEELFEVLGNDISAPGSVPSAIYAFLKSLHPSEEFHTDSGTLRTIYTAIRLGGDTDTIASMAGAMAGAHYGRKDIPDGILKHCEGIEKAEQYATDLLNRWDSP